MARWLRGVFRQFRVHQFALAVAEQRRAAVLAKLHRKTLVVTHDVGDAVGAQGQHQLDAQRAQIVAELRADLGRTAVELASKVVGESLEDEARRRGTVDRFLSELDGTSAPAAK